MRILVTGSTGMLGREVVEHASRGGHDVVGTSRSGEVPADITDRDQVERAVERVHPELIIHTAAWTAVDDCEGDPERATAVNAAGTEHVGRAADRIGARVLYVSTDHVFDGTKASPYVEDDRPNPQSVYGTSKLAGERALGPHHTIARTSWLAGLHGSSTVRTVLDLARRQDTLTFVDDQIGNPTFVADLAPALLELGVAGHPGTFHLTNVGTVSWFELAREVLAAAGLDPERVRPIATSGLEPPRAARRPANAALATTASSHLGLPVLPPYRRALEELVAQLQARGVG